MTIWEDPPTPTGRAAARFRNDALRADLRAHPGKWALLKTGITTQVANDLATRWRTYKFEARVATANDGTRSVYVRCPE